MSWTGTLSTPLALVQVWNIEVEMRLLRGAGAPGRRV